MGKRGFWQAAVSLDGTHAQWRAFVSLTLVFILPMVGCSHVWSVSPHAEPWSVLPHAEGNFAHPRVPRRFVRPSWWLAIPIAWRVVLSHAVHPSVVAFFHSRRDQRVVRSWPYLLTQLGEELCIGGQLCFPTEWKSGMFFLCFGLTDYVLGLLSSPHALLAMVSKIRFGPLWIANPLVEFPLFIHAGSRPLLCLWTV